MNVFWIFVYINKLGVEIWKLENWYKIIYINIYIVFMYVNTMGFLYWELNSGKFNVFE